jgi:hypothetical protein
MHATKHSLPDKLRRAAEGGIGPEISGWRDFGPHREYEWASPPVNSTNCDSINSEGTHG